MSPLSWVVEVLVLVLDAMIDDVIDARALAAATELWVKFGTGLERCLVTWDNLLNMEVGSSGALCR